MAWLTSFYRSTLGKKAVMAVTGIVLFGFVLVHMAGNLKLYGGSVMLNHYAEFLRTVGSPLLPPTTLLWIFRIVLLIAVALHVHAATVLTLSNWKARPESYSVSERVQATYASRTMRWGGVLIALFVFFHLAHFTFGWAWAHPDFVPGDVYHNVVAGFQVWWVSAFYFAAQLALGLHLYHGLWSMFQSLGWNNPRFNPWRRNFAALFAILITAGNVSFPLSVLAGWVR